MSAKPRVLMYSTAVCPYCVRAEQLLRARGVDEIEKVRVDLDPERRTEMMEKTAAASATMIWVLSPAGRFFAARSKPITAPSRIAPVNRAKMTG